MPGRHTAMNMAVCATRRTLVKGQSRSMGLTLLGLGLALLPAHGLRAAGFSYKEVARLGVATPGGNKLVNDFEPGSISGTGDVAFVADDDVAGNGGNNSEGLFLATNGTIKAILEPGTPVGPGAPDWTFKDNGPIGMLLSPVGTNAAGDVSFGSDVLKKGDTDVKSGNFLWIKKTGQIVALNLPDQDAPGGGKFDVTKGGTWTSVNDQEDTTFTSQVADAQGNVEEGVFVWTAADGKLHDIARPGDKVADSFFTKARRSMINNAGAVVFEGTVDKTSDVGIYLSKDGKITAIATPDTTVPGGTEKFSAVAEPRLNNKGDVIFLGNTSAGWGAYRLAANDTNLTPLVQAGAALKDGTALDQVHEKYGTTALSDSGDTAMVVNLGGGGAAVYLISSSNAAAVAKDGDNLPGVGAIDYVLGDNAGDYVSINSADQVAFSAKFKDGHMGLILATPIP
jgi:hypothetical protein